MRLSLSKLSISAMQSAPSMTLHGVTLTKIAVSRVSKIVRHFTIICVQLVEYKQGIIQDFFLEEGNFILQGYTPLLAGVFF